MAAPIGLVWNANAGGDAVTGYKLYWGTTPSNFNGASSPISVGNFTSYTFSDSAGLAVSCRRIFFAVTAVNATGESAKSSVVPANPRRFRLSYARTL